MPGKYALLKNEKNPDRMLHKQGDILQRFDEDGCPKSSLPEELRKFVCSIVSMLRNGLTT